MGVRVALGAQARDVIRLVLTDGVRLGVVGGLGALAALSAAQWVKPLLFEESPRDPFVFGIVTRLAHGDAAGELDSRAQGGKSGSAGGVEDRVVVVSSRLKDGFQRQPRRTRNARKAAE